MVSRSDPALTGLEVWLHGTAAEVDAALAAFESTGRLLYRSPRRRLIGHGDAGRYRLYLRLAITVAPPARRPGRATDGSAVLVDLAAARQGRGA